MGESPIPKRTPTGHGLRVARSTERSDAARGWTLLHGRVRFARSTVPPGACVSRMICVALLAGAAAAAAAAGCAPPDEADHAGAVGTVFAGIGGARRPVAPEVLPPPPERSPEQPPKQPPTPAPPPERPAQLPAKPQQPRAQPTVISHVMAVQPTEPDKSPPAGAQVALPEFSERIEEVMGRLDLFVQESLRLQQSLLRLHLGRKRPEPPQPDTLELSELPVGL